MIAHLIGPNKWIPLAKEMAVYPPETFDEELKEHMAKHR